MTIRIFLLTILMLVCQFSGFAGVLEDESLFDKEKHSQESDYFQTRKNEFSIIEPLPIAKYDKDYSFSLLYLYERNLPKLLTKDLSHLSWKKKYYSLLKRLALYKELKDYYEKQYKKPTDFNVVIIIYDLVPRSKDQQSYCNIYINQKKVTVSKKTLLSQKKKIKLKVKTDTRYLLFVEKFYFDKQKNKWERMLNLYQPKQKYFRVPENRIMVIKIIYDSSKERPETARFKYQYLSHYVKVNEDI